MGEPKNSSRSFGVWLMLLAVMLVVGMSLYYGWRTREPKYQGKTSAAWFGEFQKASSRYWIPLQNPALPAGARRLDLEALLRDPAADGLRAHGTNAALYLGRQYVREDSIVGRTYRNLYFKLPGGMRRFVPNPPRARNWMRGDIAHALLALGEDATPAVPALITALRNRDAFTLNTTLYVLSKLRFDRHALNPVLEHLSAEGAHTNVVRIVTELQARTPAAATCLARALAAGDSKLRESTLLQLEGFGPRRALALPEITAALADSNENVRYYAVRCLEAIGREAAPAIPALIQTTNDSSIMVQRAGARALRAIQGQSAE